MITDYLFFPILLAIFIWAVRIEWRLHRISRRYSLLEGGDLTGAQYATSLLNTYGMTGVTVEPRESNVFCNDGVVGLSPEIYDGRNLLAYSVAAHECGHAQQKHENFWLYRWYLKYVTWVSLGEILHTIFLVLGCFFPSMLMGFLVLLSTTGLAICYCFTCVMECDANKRARKFLTESKIVGELEMPEVNKLMYSAFSTYLFTTALYCLGIVGYQFLFI